jgi:hypothetical protein
MLLQYGRSVWRSGQGCFLAKTGPRVSRRCVRCLRGPSGETWILRGWLPLPEAGLGRGEIVSLEWTEPWLNRTHQAFAALCWWGLPAEIRSLGGTPIYGPWHYCLPKGEKVVTRAYISLKYPFLAIHAKGGESISPKQKDRTTTNFQNLKLRKGFKMMIFSIDILLYSKRGRKYYFQIWYLKPLLNTKRRILLRGSFV